jgi:hypothetical protein
VLAANASTGRNGFLVLQAAFSDAYHHSFLSFTFVKFLLDGEMIMVFFTDRSDETAALRFR